MAMDVAPRWSPRDSRRLESLSLEDDTVDEPRHTCADMFGCAFWLGLEDEGFDNRRHRGHAFGVGVGVPGATKESDVSRLEKLQEMATPHATNIRRKGCTQMCGYIVGKLPISFMSSMASA